jgi:pimeloyl-ACP methyl ester carboxylesterase
MKIKANGIDIEIEDTGADGSQAGRPVVLLIMGLGMQLVAWPQPMIAALVDAGFRVIRHDNRDVGLSDHFNQLGTPNIIWATLRFKMGLPVTPPYSLTDMAKDSLGVLDALDVSQAHVLGMSMGGMVAQRVALAAPGRVRSLTSIMSSSGARGLPEAQPQVLRALFGRPASREPEAVLAHYVKIFRLIGSPGFPMEEQALRAQISTSFQRSYNPAGSLRQTLAIGADTGRRANELGQIKCPTLVIHGHQDPLVPYACGEDTARRIVGAKMVGVAGMGHDLSPGVLARIMPHTLEHLRAA